MEHPEHVQAVAREVAAIAAIGPIAIDTDPLAEVPGCPGWTLTKLLTHIGQVGGFWLEHLAVGVGSDVPATPDRPAAHAELVAWASLQLAALETALGPVAADTEVWTFTDDRTGGFVSRRLAHELAVHRVDLEGTVGTASPIDAAQAIDGIDELFMMLGARRTIEGGTGETVHLHATDAPGEWLVTWEADGLAIEHQHAKGDLALRGAASDLMLLLYGRPTSGEIAQFGDDELRTRFLQACSL